MILEIAHKHYLKTCINNPWNEAAFKEVYRMTNDTRGKFGEEFFSEIIHGLGWTIDEDVSDKNIHIDGHYDIKFRGIRAEIKLSCCSGSSNTWQHEPLYKEDSCDLVIFIDIDYNDFYLTIVQNKDLPLNKTAYNFFGKKHGTLRKNKTDGYKLDFSRATIDRLIKAKKCKKFNSQVSKEELQQWVEERVNDELRIISRSC